MAFIALFLSATLFHSHSPFLSCQPLTISSYFIFTRRRRIAVSAIAYRTPVHIHSTHSKANTFFFSIRCARPEFTTVRQMHVYRQPVLPNPTAVRAQFVLRSFYFHFICSVPVHAHNRFVFYSKQSFCLSKQCRSTVFSLSISSLYIVATIVPFLCCRFSVFFSSFSSNISMWFIFNHLFSSICSTLNVSNHLLREVCAFKRIVCGDNIRTHHVLNCKRLVHDLFSNAFYLYAFFLGNIGEPLSIPHDSPNYN